jgi:hypothetical protein
MSDCTCIVCSSWVRSVAYCLAIVVMAVAGCGAGQDGGGPGGTATEISSDGRFVRSITNQPVVHDNTTTLDWQGCAAGLTSNACAAGMATKYSWSGAWWFCSTLDWGGYQDWRMPGKDTLASILDTSRTNPAIDTIAFPATPSYWFWACSFDHCPSQVDTTNSAWFVDFAVGGVGTYVEWDSDYVRCVRGAS